MASSSDRRLLCKDIIFGCLLILFLSSLPLQSDCMENNTSFPSSGFEPSLKKDPVSLLPIQQVFTFPSPLPHWNQGTSLGKFASGIIDLGGIQVCQVSNLTQVWNTTSGWSGSSGISFYEPSSLPKGFSMLATYAQPNNRSLFGQILVAKDVTGTSLKRPDNYTLIWSSENNTDVSSTNPCFIFQPNCSNGYLAVGYIVTTSPQKPSLDRIKCVRSDFTNASRTHKTIWEVGGLKVSTLVPLEVGVQSQAVPTGSFSLQNFSLPCLRNKNLNLSSAMPNLAQIHDLMKAYNPMVFFNPNETFLPSSVEWFLDNGALLYTKGNESDPVKFNSSSAKLLSSSEHHWLDLPKNETVRERMKRGNLQDASAYVHVKQMLGGTVTDLAIWLFYPFNGPATLKIKVGRLVKKTFHLTEVGKHVGDWEHVTLRVSNFNGELISVFYSQHSGGDWLTVDQVEFQNGTNKPVVYSSECGHAAYPHAGENLLGSGEVWVKNDCGKGGPFMDTGRNFTLVSAEHLGKSAIVEPFWLDYCDLWGPHVPFKYAQELKKFDIGHILNKLPTEFSEECGPNGPKCKDSWSGGEQAW